METQAKQLLPPEAPKKPAGNESNMLLGLGIAFVVMGTINQVFVYLGALFLIGWGWLIYDTQKKKKEIDLKAYGQKNSN